jgi:hypothetical protein
MITMHFSKPKIERLAQDKNSNTKSMATFLLIFLNSKNYSMSFMFPNKIANLNIKRATIFAIFASVLSKLYFIVEVTGFDRLYLLYILNTINKH